MTSALVVRSWNGHAIQRRLSDGFINATSMCGAAKKRWRDYYINQRSSNYLQALQGSTGFPADLLVETITTGLNANRGTWVHPRLAVDLARWISPEFAVWMDGWILEELEARSKPQRISVEFLPEDASDAIDLACADLMQIAKRLAGQAGWPHPTTMANAKDCLVTIRQRLDLVERLLPLAQKQYRSTSVKRSLSAVSTRP